MPTIRGKRFTDESLLGLANIETIRSLALYNTAVTDDGLAQFARRATRLASFHISSERMTDRGLLAILKHTSLSSLQVHDAAEVTDACAAAIAAHTGLRELYLDGTGITDEGVQQLLPLTELWSFSADDTLITDRGLEYLGRLPNLGLLTLNNTRVRGTGLAWLADLDDLNLYLEDCRLADDAIAEGLPRLTLLRLLSLSKTDIGDHALAGIGACRRLENLRLAHTRITDATLDLLEDLPALETLYVEGTAVTRDRLERFSVRKDDVCIYSDYKGC